VELLKEIENFLVEKWGKDYYSTKNRINFTTQSIAFSKPLWNCPTILMVVKPPFQFDSRYSQHFRKEGEPIQFFLYDIETNLVFGCISEIEPTNDWKEKLFYKIITAEDKMNRCECPECNFWLLERSTQHGHKFMGCSGFPECTYSAEVEQIYDDEIL
jgi:hypothetical protein